MAVAHDAVSDNGGSGHNVVNGTTWTHTPVGTPRGVLVFIVNLSGTGHTENNLDGVAVTYGGVSLTPVTGGYAHCDTAEGSYVRAYFLGSGVPTGAQTVKVNGSTSYNSCKGYVITVTADGDTEAVGAVAQGAIQTLSEVNVDDGSPGTNSLRYAAIHSGISSPPPVGSNSTMIDSEDQGSTSNSVVRETTAGQGSRPVGWSAGAEDVGAVYLAIREAVAAPSSTWVPRVMIF